MAEGNVAPVAPIGSGDGAPMLWVNPKWRMELLIHHHTRFCLKMLESLPNDCEELETQRMTILQFAVTSLDILNQVHVLKSGARERIVNWIYRLQITDDRDLPGRCGFTGSTGFMLKTNSDSRDSEISAHLCSSHITMTYAALVSLLTLGDDLSRVDRNKILKGLSKLQKSDGSFRAGMSCDESDMRFVYCAVCICYILDDFSTIDVPKLVKFIKNSFTYEGSFTSGQGAEGHAGHTFCAVASLMIMEKLNETLSSSEIERLLKWCLRRQEGGFTGRPNKSEDTCYSYWVGGTLALLDSLSYIDNAKNVSFVLGNQNPLKGGIGKADSDHVDPLHTFLGLAGLSLVKYNGLNSINPKLTMSNNALKHLNAIKERWASNPIA